MIRLDRTGRGIGLDSLSALARIYALGVKVHTRQDGDVSIARASDTFGPVLRILAGAVENEARRDKAVRHYENRRTQGRHIGSLPPYGTRLDEAGEPIAVEPQASVVRRAFELRAQGLGYRTIARNLHADSPPKVLRDGTERSLTWHQSSIRYWINCRTYIGIVVDEELWKRANSVSLGFGFKSKENTVYPWPLSGAIRCECGKKLTGNPSKSNFRDRHGKKKSTTYCYRYYLCPNPLAHGGKALRWRAEKLEAQIPSILTRIKRNPTADKKFGQRRDKKRVEIERRLNAAEKRTATIGSQRSHAWDQAAKGGISDENLRHRLEALDQAEDEGRREVARAREELGAIDNIAQNEVNLQRTMRNLARRWGEVPPAHQRVVSGALSRAVGGLIVGRGGIVRTFWDIEQDRLLT